MVRTPDGIQLANWESHKLWLACLGGKPRGTGGLKSLHKKMVKVVKPGAGDGNLQDDGPSDKHQGEDRTNASALRPSEPSRDLRSCDILGWSRGRTVCITVPLLL